MNDLSQVRLEAAAAGDAMQRIIDMMIDGVAFCYMKDKRIYHVYTHEGDDLGTLLASEVQFAVHYMKLRGRPVGTMLHEHPAHPGLSFAWVGLHWLDQLNQQGG
jgi:hypothetical protein